MPKKRFTSQYSKPQSTVHPSLRSPATTSQNDVQPQPSVNELIASLRKSNLSAQPAAATTNTAHTLPPQIRHLLAEPETPGPRPRARRRFDANGRLIPPGPSAPQSWLESSRNVALRKRHLQHAYPTDLNHLPGLPKRKRHGMDLVDICLRNIATHWEEMHDYERNNLVYLPVKLRTMLLSYIAVHGPEEGVGYDGLRNLILPPMATGEDDDNLDDNTTFSAAENNEGFFRLDLSGAMGKSVSFKQLTELIEKPPTPPASDDEITWEETMSLRNSLTAPIPILTHLSLSHPARTISWPRFLSFAKLLPNLTHLSLAYWPVPSLTPNASTAVMQSANGTAVQYGGTNYYSHTLDNDFREAAEVLRRLTLRLYGLEYLDLIGNSDWLRALRWTGEDETDRGIDWSTQWTKLSTLKVFSGLELNADSDFATVEHFVQCFKEALATEDMLRWWMQRSKAQGRRAHWIEVVKDDWAAYGELWAGHRAGGNMEDVKKKRALLDTLKGRNSESGHVQWRPPVSFEDERVGVAEGTVERLSVWEQ